MDYDVTVALTYYLPYMSGVTHAAQTVAEGLAARGWKVAVIASRHDRTTPARERINGVDVYRAPVLGQITGRRSARRTRCRPLGWPAAPRCCC